MTTFNQTVTNTLNLFGPQDTNKWGVMVWGVDNWAYSSIDLPIIDYKLIDNTMTLDSSVTTLLELISVITNSLSLDVDMTDEEVFDGAGYNRLFGNQANAENRPLTSYTNIADQTSVYTSVPRPTTSYTTQ